MPEQYFNNYSTTVATGGYTSGSGVLNVAATAGITLNSGDTCRLLVYRLIVGVLTPIVLLKATVVNSSTQFAVAAEGSDASALAGDNVINVLSTGGMNQIRNDVMQMGPRASLPGTTSQQAGNCYKCTDSPYEFVFNGSVWVPFVDNMLVTEPISANFTWANQGAATISSTFGGEAITSADAGGNQWRVRYMAAPSTPYSITIALKSAMNLASFNALGICFYNSSSGKLVIFGPAYNGAIEINNWTSVTTISASVSGPFGVANWGPLIWLQVIDDGTNFTFNWSGDGVFWTTLDVVSRTAFLTPQSVGYCINPESFAVTAWLLNWTQGT